MVVTKSTHAKSTVFLWKFEITTFTQLAVTISKNESLESKPPLKTSTKIAHVIQIKKNMGHRAYFPRNRSWSKEMVFSDISQDSLLHTNHRHFTILLFNHTCESYVTDTWTYWHNLHWIMNNLELNYDWIIAFNWTDPSYASLAVMDGVRVHYDAKLVRVHYNTK